MLFHHPSEALSLDSTRKKKLDFCYIVHNDLAQKWKTFSLPCVAHVLLNKRQFNVSGVSNCFTKNILLI